LNNYDGIGSGIKGHTTSKDVLIQTLENESVDVFN
jgi:hypothetical protein